MDDVLGILALMDPMPNALESVKRLAQKYGLWVVGFVDLDGDESVHYYINSMGLSGNVVGNNQFSCTTF